MRVFVDFEASSLAKQSYPIEVAWAFEDGAAESHLIRPADSWTDWDDSAAAIHGISRAELLRAGEPHDDIARHMLEMLAGHELFASSPSWDGKWLSVLLRAAGLPRHALRLSDTDDAQLQAALAGLGAAWPEPQLRARAEALIARVRAADTAPIAHRALPDAWHERDLFHAIRRAAQVEAAIVGR
jgi:hypothetical protein